MTLFDGGPLHKHCLVYCGDDRCDCQKAPRYQDTLLLEGEPAHPDSATPSGDGAKTQGGGLILAAYDLGFAASGEGWNGEYPDNACDTDGYRRARAEALAALAPPPEDAVSQPRREADAERARDIAEHQRNCLFEFLHGTGVRLGVIDPNVACGVPQLMTAMDAYFDHLQAAPDPTTGGEAPGRDEQSERFIAESDALEREELTRRALKQVLGLFDQDGYLSCSGNRQLRVIRQARDQISNSASPRSSQKEEGV